MNNTRPQPDFGFFTAKPLDGRPTEWDAVDQHDLQRNELLARELCGTWRNFSLLGNHAVLAYVTHDTRIDRVTRDADCFYVRIVDAADMRSSIWLEPTDIAQRSRQTTEAELLTFAAQRIASSPEDFQRFNELLNAYGLPGVYVEPSAGEFVSAELRQKASE